MISGARERTGAPPDRPGRILPGSGRSTIKKHRPVGRAEKYAGMNSDNPTGGPSQGFDPAGYHDTALRTHMVELVRLLTQDRQYERLTGMLNEHRQFIDQVLATVNEE